MKVYLDTNILIDFLGNRGVFTLHALEIFDFASKNRLHLFTSTHVFANAHYVLKKYTDDRELRKTLFELTDYVEIVDVTKSVLLNALLSDFRDFEDALQIYSSISIKDVDFIVTRNLKDFKGSAIPALAPDELLLLLKNQ